MLLIEEEKTCIAFASDSNRNSYLN